VETTISKKTIIIFLAIATGLAWILQGIIPFVGGLETQAAILILGVCMWMPTIAVVFVKLLNRKTRVFGTSFKPKFKGNIRWYLAAWLGPVMFAALGGILFFSFFPHSFDANLVSFRVAVEASFPGTAITDSYVQKILILQLLVGIGIYPLINAIVGTLGEEIGWRGFLFPAVQSRVGEVKAYLLCGVIWGLWHAPVIAMGHNYGTGYSGYPWLGALAMCVFCTANGALFSFVTSKSGSIWPAALGHGALNAVTKYPALFGSVDMAVGFSSGSIKFWYTNIIGIPALLCFGVLLVAIMQKNKDKAALHDL